MTFLKKLHIHPLLLLFIVLSFITGTFVQLCIVFTIIFIHELGHYRAANRYHWRIQAIILWIFGGVMKTTETTNRPIREDILVTLAGPLQHVWMYGIIYALTFFDPVPAYTLELAFYYNSLLFVFNLLPIYPLDGGKLLLYVLSTIMPFKKAHQYTYKFSILACISLIGSMLLFYPLTLSAFLLMLFLLWENIREWKHHPYTFIRFLLNRHDIKKKDVLVVGEEERLSDIFPFFRRNRYHYIKVAENEHTISETEALTYYFKKRRIEDTILQLVNDP